MLAQQMQFVFFCSSKFVILAQAFKLVQEQARLTNLQVIEIDGLGGFPTGDDDDSSGPGLGPIVGGIVAAVVVIIGAIAAFLFIRRRRRQQMNVQKHLTEPVQDHAYEDAVVCFSRPPCNHLLASRLTGSVRNPTEHALPMCL